MSLQMPPAEPPADDVAELLEHIAAIRQELADAERQRALLHVAAADVEENLAGLSDLAVWRHGLRYGLELRLAGERVEWWQLELQMATRRAHARGIVL